MTTLPDQLKIDLKTTPLMVEVGNTQLHVTPEQFDIFCLHNPDLRLELSPTGELIVMPPTGGETGARNINLAAQVYNWNESTELGWAFDSSTGYDLSALGGGKLSPDVSWISAPKLAGVDITGFIPVVPDFVIELRSRTDVLTDLQSKMQKYQQLGVQLGLLINPQGKTVEIYPAGTTVQVLELPTSIDCSSIMPNFTLNLSKIW
jgi:Uma2 family endonuclease